MNELRGWIVKRTEGLGWCYDVERGAHMDHYLGQKSFTQGQEVRVILQSEDRKKQATLAARVTAYPNGLDLCYLIDKTDPNKALLEAKFEHDELFTARVEHA